MLDIENVLYRLYSMTPSQINDIFKCALNNADIPFLTDGSGTIELHDLFPKPTEATLEGEINFELTKDYHSQTYSNEDDNSKSIVIDTKSITIPAFQIEVYGASAA